MNNRLFCYYISPTQDPDEYGGWVPSVVYEDDDGHYPLTGDPEKLQAPYIWGNTYKQAKTVADAENRKLGLTPQFAARIVTESMTLANKRPRRFHHD